MHTGCPTLVCMRMHGRLFISRLTLDRPFLGIFPDREEQLVIIEKKSPKMTRRKTLKHCIERGHFPLSLYRFVPL